MIKEGEIEISGVITTCLPNATFRVQLEDGRLVLASVSGKMRLHRIRVLEGDSVTVLMTPYDSNRGRITHRQRVGGPASPDASLGEPTPEGAVATVEEVPVPENEEKPLITEGIV